MILPLAIFTASLRICSTHWKRSSSTLIINRFGQPYTASGLKATWEKNKQRLARDPGIVIADWTYHDIKAKGISDFEGDKQKFSGHKSARQAGEYDRKTQVTPNLETPQRPLFLPDE